MNAQCMAFIVLAAISFAGVVATYTPPKKYSTYHVAYIYQNGPRSCGWAACQSTIEGNAPLDMEAIRQSIIRDSKWANGDPNLTILSIAKIR